MDSIKKEVTILHLSDLHLSGNKGEWKRLYNFLEKDITKNYVEENQSSSDDSPKLYPPDIIVVSGDISNDGYDYSTASQFLNSLKTFVGNDHNRVVIVPGNHDINWDTAKKCYEEIEFDEKLYEQAQSVDSDIRLLRDGKELKLFKRDDALYSSRFNDFSKFFGEFYNGAIHYPNTSSNEFIPYEYKQSLGIVIVGFNSCSGIDHLNNQPSLNKNAITESSIHINSDPEIKKLLRIAVWHHGYVANPYRKDFLQKEETIELLEANDYSLLLHGHMHESQYHQEILERGGKIPVIGSGTLGATSEQRPGSVPYQYNLITINLGNNICIVHRRKRKNESSPWTPDIRWSHAKNSFYTVDLPFRTNIVSSEFANNLSDGPINGSPLNNSSAPIIDLRQTIDKKNLKKMAEQTIRDRFGLREPRFIFGRNKDVVRLYRRLVVAKDNVCIQGPQWSGKKAILQALGSKDIHNWVNGICKIDFQFKNIYFIYLDLRSLQRPEDIFEFISSKIDVRQGASDRKDSYTKLFDILEQNNKRLVLLMNHFDSILAKDTFEKDFFNMLRSYSTRDTLTIAYTHTFGRDFSKDAITKTHYFNAAAYPITFLPEESIDNFVLVPLQYAGYDNLDQFLPIIKQLGGNHPFFLAIARRILFDLLDEKEKYTDTEINWILREQFGGEVTSFYTNLLCNLSKNEKRQLDRHLKREKSLIVLGEKIRSLGVIKNETFELFSDHFRGYFLDYYYPRNPD